MSKNPKGDLEPAPSSAPEPEAEAKPTKETRGGAEIVVAAIYSVSRVLEVVVDRFGWPGTLVVALFYIVQFWASPEQRRELIDIYLLGKGIAALWPILALSALYATLSLAQHRWYKKKLGIFEERLIAAEAAKEKAEAKAIAAREKLKAAGKHGGRKGK